MRVFYLWRVADLASITPSDDKTYVVSRATSYCAVPQTGEKVLAGRIAGVSYRRLAVPYLDGLPQKDSDVVAGMGRDVNVEAGCAGNDQLTVSYEIGLATRDELSIRWSYSYLVADEGYDDIPTWNMNYLLGNEMKPLTPQHLFSSSTDWKDMVETSFVKLIRDKAHDGKAFDFDPSKVIMDPDRWLLTPAGIRIDFRPEELWFRTAGGPIVTLPWIALASILKKGLRLGTEARQ